MQSITNKMKCSLDQLGHFLHQNAHHFNEVEMEKQCSELPGDDFCILPFYVSNKKNL